MLVIINSIKSIVRSKGRNILIAIIVLAIAASSSVALAIRNAAQEAEQAGVDSVNITGSISLDRQKLMESIQSNSSATDDGRPDMSSMRELMSEYQDLSLTELQTYAESDYVKNFYYSSSISLAASGDLEAYSTSDSSSEDESSNTNGFPGGMGGRENNIVIVGRGNISMGDFTVTGYSSEDAMTKFMNGTSQITDGNLFDIDSFNMNCLISNELAIFNSLSIGDTITLGNPNSEAETYTFTIVGFYTDSSSSEIGNMPKFSTSQDPANLICISYSALQEIMDNSTSVATTETDDNGNERSSAVTGQISGTFVFSNQENYEAFSKELTTKGLSEYYTLISSDISNYETSLVPLKNLSQFATTLLLIVLAIGAVILIVINIFNIRERKYEVGVLTAIGIKKGKVAMQFVTELLCVTLMSIVIGAGVGAAISVPISNNLLSSQIEQMQSETQNQNQNFGRPDARDTSQNNGSSMQMGDPGGGRMMSIFGSDNQSDVNYLDKIHATINFLILGQLIGIGILLTLISSFAAVIFVLRYEPLKILANRA